MIIFIAILALFLMLHMIPGDPVSIALGPRATPEVQAAYAAKMHLDRRTATQSKKHQLLLLDGLLEFISKHCIAYSKSIIRS